MSEVPDTTRDKILHLLRIEGPQSLETLSQALGVTVSATRQQMAILQSEGIVVTSSVRKGPGRPKHLYTLTDKAESHFTKRYADVALSFIDTVVELEGEKKLIEVLTKRRKTTEEHYLRETKGLSCSAKFKRIGELQDSKGYMAETDRDGDTLVLREHNCPFIDVARKYPQFCESERRLYEKVLKKKVRLKDCRARGADVCVFCTDAD